MNCSWPARGRLIICTITGFLMFAAAPFGQANAQDVVEDSPTVVAPEDLVPQDEFDRGTPQRSLIGFLSAAQDRDFERAVEYLDLRNLPKRMQLSIVIEREVWLDFEEIDDTIAGATADGLPSYRDQFGVIETEEKPYVLLIQRVPRGDGVFIWKVSNRTMRKILRSSGVGLKKAGSNVASN